MAISTKHLLGTFSSALVLIWPGIAFGRVTLPDAMPAPVLKQRPETAKRNADQLPDAVTPPAPRPTLPASPPPELRDKPATPVNEGAPAPPKNALPSAAELACRTRLTVMGAKFKETKVEEKGGCLLPFPIELSAMSDKISVVAPITLNCATAEAASKFMNEVASPTAKTLFGSELKSFNQASGYVCRPRNDTTKLSEHAFGNAIDIASFTLANGAVIAVEPAPPALNQKFLRHLRDAACGPFKTVLGPGSNADHELHFHFDLAQRRNGGTYCK